MKKSLWGKTKEGADVQLFTLTSGEIEVRLTDFGAHLVSVRTPDRTGKVADVVLGFDSLEAYLKGANGYQGAVVGRFANRIAKGQFTIDGTTYQIPINNGPNALHGGPVGFDRYVWKAEEVADGVEFTHVSPDGDMGFPGTTDRQGALYAQGQHAAARLLCHHRQGDGSEPDQPLAISTCAATTRATSWATWWS